MRPEEDAYGRLILDHLEGRPAVEIVERDDGFVNASGGPTAYFAPFRRWPKAERAALHLARGRVLDVGCGAGRVALHLQTRGHEVVGVDISPLAVEVAKRRGARDVRVLSVTKIGRELGRFDTFVMYGSNFGLVGGFVATNDPTVAERLLFLQKSLGAVPGPFDCWLVLRGLKTLAVRMRQHCENAGAVGAFLERHPRVERVLYPGCRPTQATGSRRTRCATSAG